LGDVGFVKGTWIEVLSEIGEVKARPRKPNQGKK